MRKQLQELIDKGDFLGVDRCLLEAGADLPSWERLLIEAAVCFKQGRKREGESKLLLADSSPNRGFEVTQALARFYLAEDNQQRARIYAKRSYEEAPQSQRSLLAYMHTLLDVSDYKAVLELFEKHKASITFNRQFTLAAVSALRASGSRDRALSLVKKLLAKLPDDKVGLRLLADIYADADSRTGLAKYKESISKQIEKYGKPDVATCWNASLHFLRHREFEEGWSYWEMGFGREVGTMARKVPEQLNALKRLRQDDTLDPSRWVIVVPEQGIGDQILFLSGLLEIANHHPRLILIADQRIHALAKRSFPKLYVAYPGLADGIGQQLGLSIQGFLPYGSILPRVRRSLSDFPKKKTPFLIQDSSQVKKIRQQLIKKVADAKLIGISWKGGFWETQKKNKGIDFLAWVKALKMPGVHFVALQYGDIREERQLCQQHGIKCLFIGDTDFKKDIEKWTNIAAACDGIFSVSTALVHFTGALGIRTRIVLPNQYGPWVLGMDDEHHLVYPNTDIRRKAENVEADEFLSVEMKDFCATL